MSHSEKNELSDVNGDAVDQTSPVAPTINPGDIRFAAMNLLARREHTRRELKQKLQRRFPDNALIDVEIKRLSDENLQSDERFAENFVQYRAGLGFGMMHIRQDMRQRGLSDAEISSAMEAADIDWCTLAKEVYSKKFGTSPVVDIKERAKRARYMQYRGFSTSDY